MFRSFRLIRPLLAGVGILLWLVIGTGCGGATTGTTSANGQTVPRTAGPTPTFGPTRTPYPSTGPTIDPSSKVALEFVNAAPTQIGRFTLDKQHSIVNDRGAALIYNASTGGQLTVAFWLVRSGSGAAYNLSDAVDRYDAVNQMITGPKYPLELGDAAMVSPDNKAVGPRTGVNPTVWGQVRWRNTVLVLEPDPTLVSKMTDFSQAEATELLTKLYAIIPKS